MGTKIKSTITFVWDLDKLEIADKIRFTTEDEVYEYILDSTSLLIKEALKDARIFDLIKIERKFSFLYNKLHSYTYRYLKYVISWIYIFPRSC